MMNIEADLRNDRRSKRGSGLCPGGFFGIEEWKLDQREIHEWDPDEHQFSGGIIGANYGVGDIRSLRFDSDAQGALSLFPQSSRVRFPR